MKYCIPLFTPFTAFSKKEGSTAAWKRFKENNLKCWIRTLIFLLPLKYARQTLCTLKKSLSCWYFMRGIQINMTVQENNKKLITSTWNPFSKFVVSNSYTLPDWISYCSSENIFLQLVLRFSRSTGAYGFEITKAGLFHCYKAI